MKKLTAVIIATSLCLIFSRGTRYFSPDSKTVQIVEQFSELSIVSPESGLGGDGVLSLYRPEKHSRDTFVYRDRDGKYNTGEFERIAYFFRCKLTGETHPIDPNLIEILDAIEDHFRGHEMRLISEYRSPLRNALMKRQGRGVAGGSLHMQGKAADIEIDGVGASTLRDFTYSLQGGGVGYYGSNTFVHIDTGKPRTWGWRPPNLVARR